MPDMLTVQRVMGELRYFRMPVRNLRIHYCSDPRTLVLAGHITRHLVDSVHDPGNKVTGQQAVL